jgi:hypothetical protein
MNSFSPFAGTEESGGAEEKGRGGASTLEKTARGGSESLYIFHKKILFMDLNIL